MLKSYNKDSLNQGGILSQNNQEQSTVQEKGKLPDNYQKQADDFYASGLILLHSPKTRNFIVNKLMPSAIKKAASAPKMEPEALADIALSVITLIEAKAKQEKRVVDPLIVATAGPKIVESVAKLAETANLFHPTDHDKIIAVASGTERYLKKAKAEKRITDKELTIGAKRLQEEHPDAINEFKTVMDSYRAETGVAKPNKVSSLSEHLQIGKK